MILFELCVLSVLSSAPAESAYPVTATAACPAPQGRGEGQSMRHNQARRDLNPASNPSGGTPEPTIMLLIAGAVAGYGALRMRQRKVAAADQGLGQ